MQVGRVSYWYRTLGKKVVPTNPLRSDITADVCIVGGGYTGLWSAYYLKLLQPNLRIVILEKEFCGFGASGRNGGWLSGVFPWSTERYAATGGVSGTQKFVRALQQTVPEVLTHLSKMEIDADVVQTSELTLATNAAQYERMIADERHRRYWGEENLTVLNAEAASNLVNIPNLRGAVASAGVARINPAKLVRGLCAHLLKDGVIIHEGSAVTDIETGRVATEFGSVKATAIIKAVEGYAATFSDTKRDILPLNSAQIVTEPIAASEWAKIGWNGRELIGDYANMYCYCQRTQDGRIAVGSRGTPYQFGSKFNADGSPDPQTIRQLIAIKDKYFPQIRHVPIDDAWGGILGVPRDWCAFVKADANTGMYSAGGYVGVGVATSNLAARTLADLLLGRETELTTLPWINRPVMPWEPEPFRWLGVRGMYTLYKAADWTEAHLRISASPLASLGSKIAGK